MELPIYREWEESLLKIGVLGRTAGDVSFAYDEDYLSWEHAAPVSLSLPLRDQPFYEAELMPYFRGLLPEGLPLESLAASLGLRAEDYFELLAACGLDCLGDVIINPRTYYEQRAYEQLSLEEVQAMGESPRKVDDSLEAAHLSLAGTQSKCGLYHDWSAPDDQEWYQPIGGAPSNTIVKFSRIKMQDLMVVEQLTMACARGCGIEAVRTCLINPVLPAICVERYDRMDASGQLVSGIDAPLRRHQEDLTQAFGLIPSAKYRQLPGGTVQAIADFLRQRARDPARCLEELCKVLLFNYAIGNCDGHLKNLSILYAPDWKSFTLAPAYDLVCTTVYGRFSRELGMVMGETQDIDEIGPADILQMGNHLGLAPRKVRSVAKEIVEVAISALRNEGTTLDGYGFGTALYRVDEIEEDMLPRLEVLGGV